MGILKIISIRKEKLIKMDITKAEARKEGFTLGAFLRLLTYHGFKDRTTVYRIEFEPVGKLK